jgi:hypothetical protein
VLLLDRIRQWQPMTTALTDGARVFKVHPDVIKLASHLSTQPDKLRSAAPYIFMPAHHSWIEWEDDRGVTAFLFDGRGESVTHGRGMWIAREHDDPPDREPILLPVSYDLPGYALTAFPAPGTTQAFSIQMQSVATQLIPVIWAVLALINSPKLVRHTEVDLNRLNKKRQARGRYTFHPHHEVRLNVDKRIIETVAGKGDGASRALHFVRTYLRFHRGEYIIVSPHWRGDPALGIRDTSYRVDRTDSHWED